eukprot:TRINITY_DN4449_c0_g1_i2.p1 TRINITY_DN4449_c0_g1~~TRINITY_DN4449_c0_g1_i2.p1  ORF type:complete len:408 (-),score=58.93 TRINITY_DN4449_c0_g1_i2:218-1441(-)
MIQSGVKSLFTTLNRTKLIHHRLNRRVCSTSSKNTEQLSTINKMALVMEKAQSITEKLNKGAFFLKEDQFKHVDSNINPFVVVDKDMTKLNENISEIIQTQHPMLFKVAKYYFDLKGKRMRPVVILLMSKALSYHTSTSNGTSDLETDKVLPNQSKLAEILEMIHTASLIHDDVIDLAESRRSTQSVNVAFGNKVSILAGDFLLARASIALAQLQNFEVTELMSRVISDLVEGEFMQMKATKSRALDFDYYIEKTYYKTASLIANGCRAAAVLANLPQDLVEVATVFGRHFGLAFQLVDDMLDFVASSEQLGKPAAQDLSLGLATAPALYAMKEFPELKVMIERNFSSTGDALKAFDLIKQSSGIKQTRELAESHINQAIKALDSLQDSIPKRALVNLAQIVLSRTN